MPDERQNTVRHLKRAGKKLILRRTSGAVFSIAEFARQHFHRLAPHEVQVIKQKARGLPSELPARLTAPLRRSEGVSPATEGAVRVHRAGGRSAYWRQQHLHFKGCCPERDLTFPVERLDFGSNRIEHDTIQFGSMSAEGVMREILAYCFLSALKLPIPHTPVCVFEYRLGSDSLGYCYVSRREDDARTEERLDYFGLSIRDLIHIKALEKRFDVETLKGDVGYAGLDARSYADEKARLLVSMNMNGGFRGILNSNLGNDILLCGQQLVLCDFDTFCIIKMPTQPSSRFLRSFCLWCLAELIKTSPMVWDYLDLKGSQRGEASQLLAEAFFANSLLWAAYRKRLLAAAREKSWDTDEMEHAFRLAATTDACYQLLLDAVPNSLVLQQSYEPAMSLYIGHN